MDNKDLFYLKEFKFTNFFDYLALELDIVNNYKFSDYILVIRFYLCKILLEKFYLYEVDKIDLGGLRSMPEVKETETGIVISQDAEEEKFRVELHPDDWERSGTVWACKKDVPGVTGNGIIKAFPDEEAIKENAKSRSYAMKIISDILAEGV